MKMAAQVDMQSSIRIDGEFSGGSKDPTLLIVYVNHVALRLRQKEV